MCAKYSCHSVVYSLVLWWTKLNVLGHFVVFSNTRLWAVWGKETNMAVVSMMTFAWYDITVVTWELYNNCTRHACCICTAFHSAYTFCINSWCKPGVEFIGGLAVVAFWRSLHGPLGSGPPRASYSQRRKRKEKGKGRKKEKEEKEKEKRRKGRSLETDMGRLFCV